LKLGKKQNNMKKLLLVLLALPLIGFGQNVNIPDANFKAYLVGNTAINTNGDTEIQVSEATAFNGGIYCQSMSISNLTGIEAFTALTWLECSYNQLDSLDVSQNTALTTLWCFNNQLTSLNVSQNTALHTLFCYNNQLTSLDVSQNTALTEFICYNNNLTSLDVSQNTALTELYCGVNQLTSLNVSLNTALTWLSCYDNQLSSLNVRNGNNTNFVYFSATNNPNLYCIDVDNPTWATANWTSSNYFGFDSQSYFSNNCSGTAIEEQTTNKALLKITDLLGRETKATNQLLFYIYNDGTVEKKLVIE
jgi:hypothetical protein